MRNYEQPHRTRRWISNLVALSGHNANAGASSYQRGLAFHFHQNLSAQDVEKLLRLLVVVTDLGRARGHDFFDHA